MKRTALFILAVLGLTMVMACKSPPATIDEAFQNIYDRFKRDLILDGAKSYTVKSGDTLAAISRAEYQNGFYFPIIMLASSETVLDPDKIEPGMELTIPDVQRNLSDAKAKANIKRFLGEIADLEDDRSRPDTATGLRQLADSM